MKKKIDHAYENWQNNAKGHSPGNSPATSVNDGKGFEKTNKQT